MDRAVLAKEAAEPPRKHLGVSEIGESCERKLVYSFRWVAKEVFEARMLRLFQRGHRQEPYFAELLRGAGATVWLSGDHKDNPEAMSTFRVKGVGGHYGGTCDAIAANVPGCPTKGYITVEMKTHNTKSFAKLKEEGLVKSKPMHFQQLQTYGAENGHEWGLYMAVNKDTDELFLEFVRIDPSYAEANRAKAKRVVEAAFLPPRISKLPGWHECRFCPAHNICHAEPGTIKLPKNCRTCEHAVPTMDGVGVWACWKGQPEIAKQAGCKQHTPSQMLASTHQ